MKEVSITWNGKDISLWQYLYFFDRNFLKNGTLRWFGTKPYDFHGEINYKNGKNDGLEIVWYVSGEKRRESFYKNGELNGVSKVWGSSEDLEIPYKDGKIDGFEIGYKYEYENGSERRYKSHDSFYVYGDLRATRKYDSQGRTIEFDNIFFKEKTEYSYYKPPEKFSIFEKGAFVGNAVTDKLISEYKNDKKISTTYELNNKVLYKEYE